MKKYWRLAAIGLSVAALGMASGCSKSEPAETTAAVAEAETEPEKDENYVAQTTVKLGEYKGIKYEMPEAKITDEMLDAQLQTIMAQMSQSYEKVDRAAREGDQVIIDYVGTIDGTAFDGGTANGQPLVLGSHRYIEGFEDGLVGVKPGETVSLNLKFPDDYASEDLAGKDCVFEVTVQQVQEKKVYDEVNDEFVEAFLEQVPVDEKVTTANFREFFRDYLVPFYQDELNTVRDSELINQIVENSEIECSTDLINKEYESRKNLYASQGAMYGLDYETVIALSGITDEQVREEGLVMAKQLAVLEEIAKQENITIDDDDILALVKSIGYNSKEMLLAMGGVTEDELEETVLMRKALDFVVENADITIKK